MKTTLIAMAGIAGLMIAAPALAQDATKPTPPAAGQAAAPDADMKADDGPDDQMGRMGKMRHGGMMARMDADGSGDISQDEFADIGSGKLIAADTNGDGELSVDEMQIAMEAWRKERMAERFKRRFDVDGDGKITVAELQSQQDKRFALLDTNNDGSISPEEFRKMRRMMGRAGPDGGHDGRHGKHHGKWNR